MTNQGVDFPLGGMPAGALAALIPEPSSPFPGMTLRDWFAGQALPGLIARDPDGILGSGDYAEMAYEIADAMLYQRAKAVPA